MDDFFEPEDELEVNKEIAYGALDFALESILTHSIIHSIPIRKAIKTLHPELNRESVEDIYLMITDKMKESVNFRVLN